MDTFIRRGLKRKDKKKKERKIEEGKQREKWKINEKNKTEGSEIRTKGSVKRRDVVQKECVRSQACRELEPLWLVLQGLQLRIPAVIASASIIPPRKKEKYDSRDDDKGMSGINLGRRGANFA